jgi:hypothetical protein
MSIRPQRRGSRRRAAIALVSGAALALGAAVALTSTADASVSEPTADKPVTGNATWFDALGSPFGGCGVPQRDLETQNWLALNVYDTPGDYTMYNRPMPEGDPKIGLWNNGHNCGRWIRITIGDRCANGSNDGNPGAGFCHSGGTWTADEYNGATLDFLVADSCGDPTAGAVTTPSTSTSRRRRWTCSRRTASPSATCSRRHGATATSTGTSSRRRTTAATSRSASLRARRPGGPA